MKVTWALSLVSLATYTVAQQFADSQLGQDYPGITQKCADSLNTTVSVCPSLLINWSVNNPRLESDELAALCANGCLESLQSVRQTIQSGCTTDKDVVKFDGVIYPATYVVDRFIYTHQLSCRKDSSSGKYCDEVFRSWLGSDIDSSQKNCSDCMLGAMQIQLGSPFGYDAEFAQQFASATASCGAGNYAFSTPAPYAVGASPAPAPEVPTCADPYVVQPGDSCDAIALAKGVTTYSILKAGNLRPDCSNLEVGAKLCLASPCELYRVQYDDTCESIVQRYDNMDLFKLISWNPNINVLCTNLKPLVTSLICVSAPGSKGRAEPTPTPTQDITTSVPKPTNGKDESNYPCAKWYTVQLGDYCEALSIREGIRLKDLYYLNPSLNKECSNLLLDIAYCVSAVGDINTYSGYPYSTTWPYTLTSATYATTTATFSTVEPSITPRTTLPLAPGSKSDCESYVEYVPVEKAADQREQPYVPVITDNINSCDYATTAFEITLEDFLSWNPSLKDVSPCMLQDGYRYCNLDSSSSLPVPGPDSRCLTNVGDAYPGTTSSCTCFSLLRGSDKGARLCADIAEDAGISLQDLKTWNTWAGSDCDNDVYAGLEKADTRPICVGVGGTLPTGSSSTSQPTPTSATTTTGTTTTSASPSPTPPAPTQAGIAEDCAKYHVAVDGDGCWAIANQYGIPLDDFYKWNPAVGNDCAGLWLGYAYCVKA